MPTLKSILRSHLEQNGEITYERLCGICAEEGFKVDTGRRRLDEMTDLKPIKRQSKRGSWYVGTWVLQRPENPVQSQPEGKKGLFVYKVDPKHSITAFRDPSQK